MGDAADDLFDQYEDYDLDGEKIDGVVCNRCGASGLEWKYIATDDRIVGRFVTIEPTGELHQCHLKEAADGFERIS